MSCIIYSRSGTILPIINPVKENHERGKYLNGRIRAGWAKVKGMLVKVNEDTEIFCANIW